MVVVVDIITIIIVYQLTRINNIIQVNKLRQNVLAILKDFVIIFNKVVEYFNNAKNF